MHQCIQASAHNIHNCIQMLNVKHLAMHKVQSHADAVQASDCMVLGTYGR